MVLPRHDRVEHRIVDFCRFARVNGLSAGVNGTIGALRAAKAVGIQDKQLFKIALRAVMCSSKAEWDLFEDLFNAFWNSSAQDAILQQKREPRRRFVSEPQQRKTIAAMSPAWSTSETSEDGSGNVVVGATPQERLMQADFASVGDTDLADLERIALRLLRQMSLRLSRRLKVDQLGDKLDLRRTVRLNISRGGDPFHLGFRRRKLQQRRLVILLDISGSMNSYSLFLIRYAYVLAKYFKRVNAFLFSTQLTDITAALRTRHLQDALRALSREPTGWSGGTKIGESLREFNLCHNKLLSRNTVFILLSDGWDTGEPQVLASELSAIRRRVRKVIWLNPLLGMEGYQPLTRGMNAALPHIDVFASAHNLQSLLELERHLGSAR
jgi:uncharacterized protein with von Willebrand factor type A (vWA) domain